MRHLKLFESAPENSEKWTHIKQDIDDICLELTDEGFDIEIKESQRALRVSPLKFQKRLTISISKSRGFNFKKTLDVVARLHHYCTLNDLGLQIFKQNKVGLEDITIYIKRGLYLHGEVRKIEIRIWMKKDFE